MYFFQGKACLLFHEIKFTKMISALKSEIPAQLQPITASSSCRIQQHSKINWDDAMTGGKGKRCEISGSPTGSLKVPGELGGGNHQPPWFLILIKIYCPRLQLPQPQCATSYDHSNFLCIFQNRNISGHNTSFFSFLQY